MDILGKCVQWVQERLSTITDTLANQDVRIYKLEAWLDRLEKRVEYIRVDHERDLQGLREKIFKLQDRVFAMESDDSSVVSAVKQIIQETKPNKIKAIKEIRTWLGVSLREAKALADKYWEAT